MRQLNTYAFHGHNKPIAGWNSLLTHISKPEFAHPHEVLHDKVSLTVASPNGGEAPLDPSSVKASESDEVSQKFLKEQTALWKNTHKLADVLPRAGEFDALFYVGGHGRKLLTSLSSGYRIVPSICKITTH